jgi:TolB-like protein
MNDFLTAAERGRLEQIRRRDPFARDVLQHTARILASRHFGRVQQRARDFLGFVVAKTLLGQADQIKELTIASSVFGSSDYDPAQSSMVRVAASDLRQRLADYAKHEGKDDILRITIPLSTYVPEIFDRRPTLAIGPFENWHPQKEQGYLCETIAAELAYRLEAAGFRTNVRDVAEATQPHYVLRGVIEPQDERLRISISLAAPEAKRILVSKSFDGRRDDVLRMARDVAEAVQTALQAEANALAKVGVQSAKSS